MRDTNKLLKQYKTMAQNIYLLPADRIATISHRLSVIKSELLKTTTLPDYVNGRARANS